jgi:quinol-cytochrome oxidoreductase complex cytochrome b subunit
MAFPYHVLSCMIQFLCILLLIAGRFVNFLLPWSLGELVHVFEKPSEGSPWPFLFAYVGLRFLQSSGGLAALRDVGFSYNLSFPHRTHVDVMI